LISEYKETMRSQTTIPLMYLCRRTCVYPRLGPLSLNFGLLSLISQLCYRG
jgi:hypothetical protein